MSAVPARRVFRGCSIGITVITATLVVLDARGQSPLVQKRQQPIAHAAIPEPLSPRERQTLREVEADFARYKNQAENHHRKMRQLLLREYNSRVSMLERRYADKLARTQQTKRKRHLEAIALLEKFIQDHSNHPQFTPDAMFRLADLYLDEADRQVESREEAGDLDAIADYSKSLNLWETILKRFPEYRQMAGTLYLLAYYGQTIDERRSLQLFLSLVCANKYSPKNPPPASLSEEYARERYQQRNLHNPYKECTPWKGADAELIRYAWVRGVGDHHFATPGELDEAIAAYNFVTTNKSAFLYEEALYKLAWSYYRRDFLLEAAERFDQSVIRYDQLIAEGKEPRLHLREEALQYIAVAFTDPWEGELETNPDTALERARKFYAGREKRTSCSPCVGYVRKRVFRFASLRSGN